jgi:hypothetical protein
LSGSPCHPALTWVITSAIAATWSSAADLFLHAHRACDHHMLYTFLTNTWANPRRQHGQTTLQTHSTSRLLPSRVYESWQAPSFCCPVQVKYTNHKGCRTHQHLTWATQCNGPAHPPDCKREPDRLRSRSPASLAKHQPSSHHSRRQTIDVERRQGQIPPCLHR